jgi:hypothetical protein
VKGGGKGGWGAGFGGVFVEGFFEDCVLLVLEVSTRGKREVGEPFFCLTSMPPCSFLFDIVGVWVGFSRALIMRCR